MEIYDKSQIIRDSLVSVIIPVYNVRPYLDEAIESVLHQTYTNLEIILVDDGSADGSGEICDQYAKRDPRIIIVHQNNRGLSAARNTGLDRATGDIVSFLDPDDAFCPDMIQILLKKMKEEKADIVSCGFSLHHNQDRMTPEKEHEPVSAAVYGKTEAFRLILNKKINTAVWNKLYARAIWEELRFPEGRVYEGTYLSMDIFERAEKIVLVDNKLIMHRIRPGSICHTLSMKNIQDSLYAIDHRNAFMKAHVPEVFSASELHQQVESKVKSVTVLYVSCCYKKALWREKGRVKQILLDSESDLPCCSILIRAAYYMALYCPYIFLFLYLPYRALRKITE